MTKRRKFPPGAIKSYAELLRVLPKSKPLTIYTVQDSILKRWWMAKSKNTIFEHWYDGPGDDIERLPAIKNWATTSKEDFSNPDVWKTCLFTNYFHAYAYQQLNKEKEND